MPTIIEKDGKVELVIGASGGSRIITAVANVILNALHYGKDCLEAVSDPRPHHQLLPNKVCAESSFHLSEPILNFIQITLEDEFELDIENELKKMGHKTERLAHGMYLTGVEAVCRLESGLIQGDIFTHILRYTKI